MDGFGVEGPGGRLRVMVKKRIEACFQSRGRRRQRILLEDLRKDLEDQRAPPTDFGAMSRIMASVVRVWCVSKGAPEGSLNRLRIDDEVRACLKMLSVDQADRLRGLYQGERGIEENQHC